MGQEITGVTRPHTSLAALEGEPMMVMRIAVLFLTFIIAVAACSPGAPAATRIPKLADTSIPMQPPTDTPAPALVGGATRVWEGDDSIMVYVPEGEFLMGTDRDGAEIDEKPQHTVYLDAFWIDQTEVTHAQFILCVGSATCREPTECLMGESTYADPSKIDHPVACVSWQDAVDYCEWVGKRLPTEAEWEKAARGTDGRMYPWGNEWDPDRTTAQERGFRGSVPVKSFPSGASPYGALDMVGNVYEWVADWYEEDYYGRSPDRNPAGPDSGVLKVLRGHTWDARPPYGSCTFRRNTYPDGAHDNIGFRCCVSDETSS